VVDPDATDRTLERQLDRAERASHQLRYLTITGDGAGGVRLEGRGSAEDGALLKAALLPLTTPAPTTHEPDRHDRPDGHGGEPLLVHDPRDAGARMWDALVGVAQHALDTDLPPDSHGAPARLVVTTTLASLREGLAETAVNELSVATIRRLACDAEVIPAVLGSTGEPLDVGRAKRLVTLAIWVALVLRDRHCAFPGCDRPPLMCHAHHITHRMTGGKTTTVESGVAVRTPPPRDPPFTVGSPDQPPRPKTRIPATTQTRHRTTPDPTPTTPHVRPTAGSPTLVA
jgi:hypothetical protein